MYRLLSISAFLLIAASFAAGQSEWGYVGPIGPDYWCGMQLDGNQCCGSRQSPINIDTKSAVPAQFHILNKNFNYVFPYCNITNDKHTAVVHAPVNPDNNPALEVIHDGGETSDVYLFDSLHFHFGSTDDVGSEHQIDGQQFPMEMHTVFYNSKYPSFTDSKAYSDGVVVLGTHFYKSAHDNNNFSPITDSLQYVKYIDQTTTITPGFSISSLLPNNMLTSYSYEGSLTTPVCNEVVQWFVFDHHVHISEKQLNLFREVTVVAEPTRINLHGVGAGTVVYMSDNYRPIQDLNDRTVYYTQ